MNDTIADLSRGLLLRAFHEALARHGAQDLEPARARLTRALICRPCLGRAAESLGLRVAAVEPVPGEPAVMARYDFREWNVALPGAPGEEDDEDEHVVGAGNDEVAVTFRAPVGFGLVRLESVATGERVAWLWAFEWGEYDENGLCLAARRWDQVEAVIGAAERLHAIHERERPGLIVVGECSEHRARHERVQWDQVLLPAATREDLERTVREFFASRALYQKHRLAFRRGVLLAGPPGNGKTTILKAIASTAGVPVVIAAGLQIEAKRGTLVQRAFERAQGLAPAVLCFEDLDALVEDGPALSLFLNLLDGLESLEGVLVVATTNRPDRIDPAIAKRPSRFDRVFTIPLPDRALRRDYLARSLGEAGTALLDRLATATEGLSVAFLKEVVIQARFTAVRRGDERLTETDLEHALASVQDHVRIATRGLEDRGAIGFGGAK